MANTVQIRVDAENQRIFMCQMTNPESGESVIDSSAGIISIDLRDVNGKSIAFQETPVCINGQTQYCILLRSDYYTKS